jgi:hypothetical protein
VPRAGCDGQGAGCRVPGTRWWAAGIVLLAVGWLTPGTAFAQTQAPIANARIDNRSAAQGLEREIRSVAAQPAAAWIGYRLAAAAGSRRMCGNGNRILLEAPTEFVVLARVEGGRIVRVRAVTPECEVDAGGMALVWLTDVKASESVEWLATLIATTADTRTGMQQVARPALSALGLHADAGAPKLLELARTTKNQEVRKQAMSQLSQSTDPRAIKLFEEILTGK